ncbi:MAG: hypothetical protein IPP22_15005 [Nitrosomonas sp.]|nr:hypothetical protein [Nitrosomonas sp.]
MRLPLVTLGLVLDSSGVSAQQPGFAGNASEPATLETMVTSLAGAKASALIVMDAGIATEANLQWLQERNYRYLVVSCKRQSGMGRGIIANCACTRHE